MTPATTTRTCRTCSEPIPSAGPEFVVFCVDASFPGVVGFYCAHNNRCVLASEQHAAEHPGETCRLGMLVPDEQAARRN